MSPRPAATPALRAPPGRRRLADSTSASSGNADRTRAAEPSPPEVTTTTSTGSVVSWPSTDVTAATMVASLR